MAPVHSREVPTRRCPDNERACRPLLLGEGQELRRKLAHHVAVERYIVRDPEAEEDREQQQRVFGRLSERFSLFDQLTCPLHSRLGFRRGIPFDMEEWGYERDLKLDLFATQCRRGGQGRDLVKGTGELLHASTSAERSSDRCPALPHRPAAFSISPASVQ